MGYAFLFKSTAARAALATVLASAFAAPVLAADNVAEAGAAAAADEPQDGLQEIIVTAQKRAENLQDTPISISVLSAQSLQDRHVTSLLDLGDGAVPGLKVAPFFSRPGALIVNIRGIGVLSDSNQPARDQGVGIYVDGVYMGRPQGLNTALYDVEDIEILKGPQGTLFGRNTIGGAVNIVTRKPSGEFKLNSTFGFGNYGSYKGEVHLDLPEFANIALKIDGVVSQRDAMVTNPNPSQLGFNSFDKQGVAVTALWRPVNNFSVEVGYDKFYDATSTLYLQQISAGVGLPVSSTGSAAILPNTVAAIFQASPVRRSSAIVGVPQQPSIGKGQGVRGVLLWEASPDLRFKSITSYRDLTQTQFDNGSADTTLQQATPPGGVVPSFAGLAFGRYSLAPFKQNQFSQELQVIGELPRFKYQAGALYFREKVEDSAQAFNTMSFTDVLGSTFITRPIDYAAQVVQRASKVRTTSIGVYGQATYTPAIANDIFHLTVGARWTRDKKDGTLLLFNGLPPSIPVGGVTVTGPINRVASWSRVDPLVNLAIDLSDDVMVYGKWSSGYRSGGANSRSVGYKTFDPETVSVFEIGAKTEFLNNRARFNIAAYAGNYKNVQLDFQGLYEDVVNGVRVATTRTTQDTVNAPGTGKIKGVEAELTLVPFEGLQLSASYAYNDVTIPATQNPFPQSGGVFITVPVPIYQVYTPDHTGSVAIDYRTPVGGSGAAVTLHLDGNYDSGFYANYTDVEYDTVTRAVRYFQPKGDPAFIVNGRIALADIDVGAANARATIAVWARNLFNEQHLFYKAGSARAGVQGFFNDFRTFGVEVNIKM